MVEVSPFELYCSVWLKLIENIPGLCAHMAVYTLTSETRHPLISHTIQASSYRQPPSASDSDRLRGASWPLLEEFSSLQTLEGRSESNVGEGQRV